MTNITKYPLVDGYETTLSQSWDGAVGTINLNSLPTITFPSGVTTFLVVNPGKINMQVAEIDTIDTNAMTANVVSVLVNKGEGTQYDEQTHSTGSIVRISDNFAFWEHVKDSVNSKVDRNNGDIRLYKFQNAAARDATLTSPVNGESAYLTDEGLRTDYIGGAWSDRATGATPNASETVAGKGEISDQTEFDNGTDIGATGAPTIPKNSQIKARNELQDAAISTNATNISTNATNITNNANGINELQFDVVSGETLLAESLALATQGVTAYIKVKDIEVTKAGTYTCVWEQAEDPANSHAARARIYVNDVAVSPEFLATDQSPNFDTFTYDVTVNANDNIQIYAETNISGRAVQIRNFQILFGILPNQVGATVIL